MPDLWELGPAALGASGAGHWLAKAVKHADRAGNERLSKQLRDLRERVDAVHLEIAALRRQPSGRSGGGCEAPTDRGPEMPWWAKGSNYSPNE